MAGSRDLILGLVSIAIVGLTVYLVDPSLGGLLRRRKDGFMATLSSDANGEMPPEMRGSGGDAARKAVLSNPNVAATSNEGFANLGGYEGPAAFGNAETPEGCYPRDQLNSR